MKTSKTTKKPDFVSGFKHVLRDQGYVNLTPGGHTVKLLTIEERVNTVEWQIDKIDRAVRTLASWNETGEWSGALEYINAILDETEQSKSEGSDNENT